MRGNFNDRPIKPGMNSRYNLNFIDWNNEWERVSEIEIKLQNGEEIEDNEEEARVRNYMDNELKKLGVGMDKFLLVKNVNTSKECYICLKNFSKSRKIRQLQCQHMFCEDCLRPWIKSNHVCPTCKAKLKDDNTEDNQYY
jgi:hypothetical protein